MKPLFTFLCILAICLALIIPTYAYSDGDAVGENDGTVTEADSQNEAYGEDSEENVFAIFYREVSAHYSEIFSALAFIFTAILTFSYKKGLLPLIEGGINGLKGVVGSIKEKSEMSATELEGSAKALTASLKKAEDTLQSIGDKIGELEEKLKGVEDVRYAEEQIQKTSLATLKILEEIFMSSSLPVYQKEAVARKLEALIGESDNNEESLG